MKFGVGEFEFGSFEQEICVVKSYLRGAAWATVAAFVFGVVSNIPAIANDAPASSEVVKNQHSILGNQNSILTNQRKILENQEKILSNLEKIVSNQNKLDTIIANQEKCMKDASKK